MHANEIMSLPCIMCYQLISRVYPEVGIESVTSGMWEGSSVEISGCFGSQVFDGMCYHGVICDDCLIQINHRMMRIESVESTKKYIYE